MKKTRLQTADRFFIAFFLILILHNSVLYGKDKKDESGLSIQREIALPEIAEPSGLCYSPERDSLFIAGDQGHVAELDTEGRILKLRAFPGHDFEGIALLDNRLYVLDEKGFLILIMNPDTLNLIDSFRIPTVYGTFEGMTFNTDGRLILSNQILSNMNKRSCLVLLNPIDPDEEPEVILTGIKDQSAMTYSGRDDVFYILSDSDDKMYTFSLSRGVIKKISFPGKNQEGLAIDSQGVVYAAQDHGGIIILKGKIE